VIIASYNQHIGSFLPSLFGWFAHHQSLLGSTEPTLSWNQLGVRLSATVGFIGQRSLVLVQRFVQPSSTCRARAKT
jgi:hypothetical protein